MPSGSNANIKKCLLTIAIVLIAIALQYQLYLSVSDLSLEGSGASPHSSTFIKDSNNLVQKNSQQRPIGHVFPFYFTEDDVYFGHNVRGLRKALLKAVNDGCLSKWDSSNLIHVMFAHSTQPVSQDYIQVQMEQHTSAFFRDSYLEKLQKAKQIWEFSPLNVADLKEHLNLDAFYVPTMLTYDQESPPYACCTSAGGPQFDEGDTFQSYSKGCYTKWSIKGGVPVAIGHKASEHPQRPCNLASVPKPSADNDVFFFGYMPKAAENLREKLCDELVDAGFSLSCLQFTFGPTLERFVCKAKVIVSDNYYPEASLGTHRIDPLLLAGKVVVSAPSVDEDLDQTYSDFVVFAEHSEIPRTVKSILADWPSWDKKRWENQARFAELARDVTPLCNALRQLNK